MNTGERKDPDTLPDAATLTVTVFAPISVDPRQFTWPKNERVGDAAAQAARDFGYEAGTPTFQTEDENVLDRDKTLMAAGVRDDAVLEIVDVGGGV